MSRTLIEAARDFPPDVRVASAFCEVAHRTGDWGEAIRRWDKLISDFPEKWAGYGGKAATLSAMGQTAEAGALLAREAKRRPRDAIAFHDIARWAEKSRNWAAAESAWRTYISIDKHSWWTFRDLSQALTAQGKLREAERVITEGARRFPNNIDIAIDFARSAEASNIWKLAVSRWTKIAKTWPDDPRPREALAEAKRRVSQLEDTTSIAFAQGVQP
jgi:predicted Zn-dependent protease